MNSPTIDIFGVKEWFKNGKPHREDGPAVEVPGCGKFWYLNGKRHREDGPAVEYTSGRKEWYIHGEKIDTDGLLTRICNPNYIPNEFEKLYLEFLIKTTS